MERGVIKNSVKSYVYPFLNRFYHIFLILCFFFAFLLFDARQYFYFHAVFGLLFFVGVIVRVIWGFVGTRYSRFKDFEFEGVFEYLRSILGQKRHFIGHNPASSYAIILMLTLGILLGVSGLLLWGASQQKGIFANLYFSYLDFLKPFHNFVAYALLIVVLVHICGAMIDKFYNKFDSINSMISGYKLTQKDESIHLNIFQRVFFLVSVVFVAAFFVYIINPKNVLLNSYPVPKFTLDISAYELYKKECGSCHIAYTPYLLPQKAWVNLMSELENHFGDDASLDDDDFKQISAFLNAHSTEQYNTRFKANLANENLDEIAITQYKFYKNAHKDLDDELFKQPKVRSRANCGFCHKDAELGFFGKSDIDFKKIKNLTNKDYFLK